MTVGGRSARRRAGCRAAKHLDDRVVDIFYDLLRLRESFRTRLEPIGGASDGRDELAQRP